MIRAGLIEEHEATGPQGQSFKVLTATERGRVNVEIVSDHYHAAAITAKAAAGYAMHGSSRSATRKIARALARESDRG